MPCTDCNQEPSYPLGLNPFSAAFSNLTQQVLDLTNCCTQNQQAVAPQLLGITGKFLTISQGNTITLPNAIVSYNAGTNTITIDGNAITLTGSVTNLAYVASNTVGNITSSTGATAVVPLATSSLSGLLSPAEKNKIAFLSVTQPVNLDGVELHTEALVTLSGQVSGSVNLGTFTGATIPDASTIKGALQSLETSLETKNVGIQFKSLGVSQGSVATVNEFDVQGRVLELTRTGNKITLFGSTNSNSVRVVTTGTNTNLSLLTDDILVVGNVVSSHTVHLPAATNLRRFIVKNTNTGPTFVSAASTGGINNLFSPPVKLSFGRSEEFISDGTTWYTVNDIGETINKDAFSFSNYEGSSQYLSISANSSFFNTRIVVKDDFTYATYPAKITVQRLIDNDVTSHAFLVNSKIGSSVTAFASAYESQIVAAEGSNLANVVHFNATHIPITGGAFVDSQYGFRVDNLSAGATNYGFYSEIESGLGKWNFCAAGTAKNYFAGLTGIGGLPSANHYLTVGNTTSADDPIPLTTLRLGSNGGDGSGIQFDGSVLNQTCVVNNFLGSLNLGATKFVMCTGTGFIPPVKTATQASALTPVEGQLIYVSNTNGTFTAKGWWGYNGLIWEKLNN